MKILVVSNMFPDSKHPSYGVFVKKFIDELDAIGINYDKSIMVKNDGKIRKMLGYINFYMKTFFFALLKPYDIIYIHYASHSSIPIIVASRFRKMNIYTNVHGSDIVPENRKQVKMQKYTKNILNHSNKIIVPSEYFRILVSKKYSIESKKIKVYPSGGIDSKLFHVRTEKEVDKIKMNYSLDNGLPVFGMASRISYGKGWETFVQAIKISVDCGFVANFIIVGSGSQESDLEEMIKNFRLDEKIIRLPLLPQEKLSELYSALDYFVFPTERAGESLGLVALEAMACGTPVIASDYAAPAFYVNDGKNGYKYEKGNPRKLYEVMVNAVSKSIDREKLRKEAKETAKLYDNKLIRCKLRELFDNE